MRLIVKNEDQELLGTVSFLPDNSPVLSGGSDETLALFIDELLRSGVMRKEDHEGGSEQVMVMARVEQSSPAFPLAFKESLEGAGFSVVVDHPETLEALKVLLSDIPDDDPEKMTLLARFPELSYLEQTYILEQFSEIG